MERRTINCAGGVRLEQREGEEAQRIVGVASVFYDGTPNTEYKLWQGAMERVMPTAFDRAIKEDDVRALFNHDPNQILGRTKSGTLKLTVRDDGLHYETVPSETTTYKNVRESLARGDVDGSSFAFTVQREEWVLDEERGLEIREIKEVKLYDVGPVTYPAYESTSSGVRALDLAEARESWEANTAMLKAERAKKARELARHLVELVNFPY